MSTRARAACDECGWIGKFVKTEGLAEYAYRKHSCEKHRAEVARGRRAAERAAASGLVRPCAHKLAQHQHGTHAAYVLDACRCKPCRDANRAYEQRRRRDRAFGREAYVDAAPARQHVAFLTYDGMGLKTIAAVSGVSHGSLWKLMYGKRSTDGAFRPSARVRPDTAAALLAVTADLSNLAGGARVDAIGTQRRLRALVALGYPAAELARRAGLDRQAIDAVLADERDGVAASTARTVRALYDRLSLRSPNPRDHAAKVAVSRSRNRAAAAGWALPLAWDDDTIDDPSAKPATVDVPRDGKRVHVEDVEWLLDTDVATWDSIANRLGVSRDGVRAALARADRHDLIERITAATARAA